MDEKDKRIKELEQQWEGLEKQYLELREEIMQK